MDKKNVRYNILTVIVYIIGIILLIQLFNLQIVHGEEYLEKSRETRKNHIIHCTDHPEDTEEGFL